MQKTSGFITVDGIKLECLNLTLDGADNKPTLVFLHEGLGCVALWRDFPEKLCQAMGLNGFIYSAKAMAPLIQSRYHALSISCIMKPLM